MKRLLTTLLCALLLNSASFAQFADSSFIHKPVKASDFNAKQLIVPGALMATGAVIHFAMHDSVDGALNVQTAKWAPDGQKFRLDDYLRIVPTAMNIGYEYIGGEPQHDLTDRVIETLWAYGAFCVVGYSTKAIVKSSRPDGTIDNSFPSGHACVSFAGAELVRMEYGWGCGASAYAVAAGVCVLRLYNNEHWVSDLLFGAGVGILSAHIGGWLLEPTKKILGIMPDNLSVAAVADPVSGAVCPALALRF